MAAEQSSKPLDGIHVLELGRFIAGPYCGLLMGDMGAEVIKVEPTDGEFVRTLEPTKGSDSLYFSIFNRSKKSITLNLRSKEAKEDILPKLFQWADVVIQNFRPGVMEKMGFPFSRLQEINSGIILVSISGFGQKGPFSSKVCFDAIAQAMGGLMDLTGPPDGPPQMCGTFIADYLCGVYAAYGTMLALYNREKTGKGQEIDLALLDSIFSVLLTAVPQYLLFGKEMTRIGNLDRYASPANCYKAIDGYIYISSGTEVFWERIVKVLGKEDLLSDPRFATANSRLENHATIDRMLEEWTCTKTRQEIEDAISPAGIPCGPVLKISEVVEHPYFKQREQIVTVDHPTFGKLPLPGIPFKLSETPGGIEAPPPLLGSSNNEVYAQLGYNQEQIEELKEKEII